MSKKSEDDFIFLSNKFHKRAAELNAKFLEKIIASVSEEEFKKFSVSLISDNANKYLMKTFYRPDSKDEFARTMFSECNEINTSLANLCYSLILSNKLYNKVIPANELLHYYYNNFIAEIYVFSQRVKKLFNKLNKFAKKLKMNEEQVTISKIRNDFMSYFDNINRVRASHIHEKSYSDEKFVRLAMMKFFRSIKKSENEWLQSYYKYILRNNKKFYIKNMRQILNEVESLTNSCLDSIADIVFITIYNRL